MKLWRLNREPFSALDGAGPQQHGTRYSSPGLPVVNFASEPGLATPSRVLPEADIVMMNPRHPDAANVKPLTLRPFSFAQCLHSPPMLGIYGDKP